MSSDPLDNPLPCDVQMAHIMFRKGVALRTFVEAATRWYNESISARKATLDDAGQSYPRQFGINDLPVSPQVPTGCICPPGANKDCEAPMCPRKNNLAIGSIR